MLDVVAINDSGGVKQASHLVKYDSVLGTWPVLQIVDDRTSLSMARKSKSSLPEIRCNCRGKIGRRHRH